MGMEVELDKEACKINKLLSDQKIIKLMLRYVKETGWTKTLTHIKRDTDVDGQNTHGRKHTLNLKEIGEGLL